MRADQVHFPRPLDGKWMVAIDWPLIRYSNVISVLNTFTASDFSGCLS
jgi:hypothetical protein